MGCGFCSQLVPVPTEAVTADGSARVEEVIGYRGFNVVRSLGGIRLTSPLFTETVWHPGEVMIAGCRSHGRFSPTDPNYHGPMTTDRKRNSPVKDCAGAGHGCGFYAGRTWNHLVELGVYSNYNEVNPRVIGRVQMEGKIIFATNGFRAERVWIRTLYIPYEMWEIGRDLKEAYGPHGVEIEMGSTMLASNSDDEGTKLEWCVKCQAKLKDHNPVCPLCNHNHR